MKRKSLLAIMGLLLSSSMFAQYISGVSVPDSTKVKITDESLARVKYANEISAEDLFGHLSILASDQFQGRETGEPGNDLASAYLADQLTSQAFQAVGLEGSYFQPVAFTFSSWEDPVIYVNGNRFKHLWDYIAFPNVNSNTGEINAEEVLFLGYGIEDGKHNDYKGKSVAGKVIMIYEDQPADVADKSWSENMDRKLTLAKEKGVKLVLIIKNELKEFLGENRKRVLGPTVELGMKTDDDIMLADHLYISTNIAKEIIGSKSKKFAKIRKCLTKKGKLKNLALPAKIQLTASKRVKHLEGKNVMAFVEGTDKKEEVIVISAHYDHIGMRGDEIFNGADDNGSGTSTVLEIAESFLMAKANGDGPRRSLLFLWVTGEEKGLLGSQFYAENPIFSIENTVANINIDMVGRIDKKYKDNPEYIYVIGSDRLSTELHKINETVNDDYSHLTLDYTYNDENDPNRYYYRSDHYNFAAKGIPAIFFFNGTHEDYHQPGDTVEKIEFDKMEKIGQHIFQLAWELANREERIVVDGEVR